MIKITNLNFQNQTIENIEVDGENIQNVELKLTKTTFKIVLVKEGETIKKQIKKKDVVNEVVDVVMDEVEEVAEPVEEPVVEVVEPVVEEVAEPVVEEVAEPVVEEVAEPVVEEVAEPVVIETNEINEILEPKVITLGKLKELMKEHIPKANTLDSYLRTIQQIYEHFKITDMAELFRAKEKDIINFIESKYTNNSTIKSKLCSVYKAYKILNIEGQLFKNKIDFYSTKQTLIQEELKVENAKTTEEGDEVICHFENHLEELKTKIHKDALDNDETIIAKWGEEVQLFCVLKIYLNYGVLRPSELTNCLITDYDCDDTTNYINVKTKQIVINNHKNDRNGKKVVEIDDKQLLNTLRTKIGNHLITNQKGELYQESSAFSKVFKKHFNYCPYDLRKAISSKIIQSGDVESIKKLERVQGHSLQVILDHYNKYSIKKK